MTPDDLRARLPIIGDTDDGPTGHVLLERQELPGGGTVTYAVDPETLSEAFAGADWADKAALVAADHRRVRVDNVNKRIHQQGADGTFPADAPAVAPDDVIEEEVDLGYAEHLARWHDEGRFS